MLLNFESRSRETVGLQTSWLTVASLNYVYALVDMRARQDYSIHYRPSRVSHSIDSLNLPVLRHLPQPLDAGVLQLHVGLEAPGYGAVDDGLFLLFQQPDQLLLRPHKPPHPPLHMIQIANDGGLFGEGWESAGQVLEVFPTQVLAKARAQPIEDLLQILGV